MADYSEEDVDPSESEDEENDEQDEIPGQHPRPDAVYNTVRLHEKLEEIGWPEDVDWIQTLSISYDQPEEIDVNDDLAREMAFYTQALEGTREAYRKLQAMGIPFLRPEDYYAEMVKTDNHMLKVKDQLLFQQKQMEEAEERRKAREAKRYSKEVQAQKLKERAKQKKHEIDSVKKWRNMRKKSNFTLGEDEFPVDFEGNPSSSKKRKGSAAPWDRSGGKAGQSPGFIKKNKGSNIKFKSGKGGPSKNRDQRNAKFGRGGKKGLKKKNTAESSADVTGFKGRFNKKRKR